MVVFLRSVQRGGSWLEMVNKSDSPNVVAHPKHYVIFDVMGGRAQPVSTGLSASFLARLAACPWLR